jgi:hypothetical protein
MLEDHWVRPFDQADCYYVVDGKKTYNRNLAIVWADGNLDKIHLYWLDDVWDSIDLTERPVESWSLLMKERCLQIRDKTDRLGLAFSGGYDSQTILDHLVANNIKLDDIQINHKSYLVHPEFMSAVGIANETKKNYYPNLKISTLDITLEYLLKIYQQAKENWLWSESAGELRFTKQGRSSLVNHNYQHAKLCGDRTRLVVEGHDKPRLLIDNGWWVMVMHVGVLGHVFNTPFENFYISKDLPNLHLKQVWMMIDWLESLSFESVAAAENFLHKVQKNLDNHVNEQWNCAIGRNPVKHINSWDLKLMLKHDNRGGLYSQDTVKLFDAYPELKTLPEVINWENSAFEFIKKYQQTFVEDKDCAQFSSTIENTKALDFASGKNIWTKKYPIKPVEINLIRS